MQNNNITPYADAILEMIREARQNALQSVNKELIRLYWKVGEYLSIEAEKASHGDAFINATAKQIEENAPGIRGFNRRGLYRMGHVE